MELKVIRYSNSNESTLGLLLIDSNFVCYTLEDEARSVKVFGETRIPEGRYSIGLRTEGGHHQRYSKKFPEFHKGMLHILNVPDFEYVLIHIGNTDDDTAGCLLIGDATNNNTISDGLILNSTDSYKRVYPIVAEQISRGNKVWIEYLQLTSGLHKNPFLYKEGEKIV